MTRSRPIGITILAILSGVAAAIAVIHTLQYLHLMPFFMGPVVFFGFDLWGALLWGALAVIYIWVTSLLWNAEPQGWLFLVILSAFNIGLALLSALGGTSLEAVAPAILVNSVVFIYCLLPGTKRAFGEPEIRVA